jgi:cell division septum initiation protein DivIVA
MKAIADATESTDVETLAQTVADLQETVERQAERIEGLEEQLAEHKDHTGREFADVRSRITDLEEENQPTEPRSKGATPNGGETGAQTAETPLERICALPEHVADRELTANQERARFIARDVRDYAEKAPAGFVIDSRAIKRVLTASEGKRSHTQTVARVMNFLDDLGKDGVALKKRRGRKLVVFDPKAADRLASANHSRCDRGGDSNLGSDVIGPV